MNLEAADVSTRKLSKMEAKCDTRSKSKLFSKTNAKPLTGTLDRWFKPANGAANDKKASNKTKSFEPVVNANDDEKNMRPQVSKSVRSSRNFVQRYIHINDECRVCESAKIEEAARCELRCATCSLTVHKKCYNVRGEVSDKEWNCRRCQYIYRETAWEDISGLIGVPNPESLTFPTCEPPDNNHKMHQLFTDSNFAAIFLFLQRFSRLGLQLLNVDTTLENLANALIEPKAGKLCEELHTRLLKNINVVTKKDPWYVLLWHFLREEENVPVIVKNTKFLANSVESEKREDLYLGLPVKERLAMLKLLCEAQFDRNAILVEKIGHEEAESMESASEPEWWQC
ncbi:hypothetical protein F443_21241 [Plasmopara halstedii]|uniref:Phorbol-ester/DAG-type domain-containing protein n=1 Tax=Plasmopara halstedii TaxID=4781 RepID=A0A0P1B6R4_PLAHL|nr:hypothetical protein F443_21241 [Plasmopara halstedii]CEG50112.1 hypothetical protein F443_21241 [Plasmopara halstedii]|eukprot:XP_024586481.1 hypothetical protein F443_21241 [Plasmopara halstedii]